MSKLILTIGVSQSNKTTWAKNYCAAHRNTIDLCRDHYRFPKGSNLCKDTYNRSFQNERLVTDALVNDFNNLADKGYDIIISDTNLSFITRKEWLSRAKYHGMDVEYVVFNSQFNKIFYEDSSAIFTLPEYVLTKQFQNFHNFLNEVPNPTVKYTIL